MKQLKSAEMPLKIQKELGQMGYRFNTKENENYFLFSLNEEVKTKMNDYCERNSVMLSNPSTLRLRIFFYIIYKIIIDDFLKINIYMRMRILVICLVLFLTLFKSAPATSNYCHKWRQIVTDTVNVKCAQAKYPSKFSPSLHCSNGLRLCTDKDTFSLSSIKRKVTAGMFALVCPQFIWANF